MPLAAVFLAAGLSTRFGRAKQLEPVGPAGESLLDYGIYDALGAGVERIVVVTRDTLAATMEDRCSASWGADRVDVVVQDSSEPGEWRPGGTGDAVLAAAPCLDEAFVVANADDFYGSGAWNAAVSFLRRHPNDTHAVVGYRLAATLAESGGVSRAVCDVDDGGLVTAIEEWREIREIGPRVEGRDLAGRSAALEREAWVSMNLWGFGPGILPTLARQRSRWTAEHPGREFLLSTALGAEVHAGASVHLLPSPDAWFGLTHPEDLATVQARLRRLTEQGRYPSPLSR